MVKSVVEIVTSAKKNLTNQINSLQTAFNHKIESQLGVPVSGLEAKVMELRWLVDKFRQEAVLYKEMY